MVTLTIPQITITEKMIEIDTDEVRRMIPETRIEQYSWVPNYETGKRYERDDYRFLNVTRPNPSRLAADEATVTSVQIDNALTGEGLIEFTVYGISYYWSAYQEYDTGVWSHLYCGTPHGVSERVYGSEKMKITIPMIFFEVPGEEYTGIIWQKEIGFDHLEEYFYLLISFGVNDERAQSYE